MKRILIVADEPGWVFERHALEIKKRLTEFDITVAFRKQNISAMSVQFDVVYVMDPIPLRRYPPKHKTIMGLRGEFLYHEHPDGPYGLFYGGLPGRCASYADKCSMMHVVNRRQLEAFESVVTDRPLLLAQHGVDEEVFDASQYHREKSVKLRVSMAGRSSSNKGFDMVRRACNEAGVSNLAALYRSRLTKDQMPGFYSQADIHVCMSASEGLNNSIMEAGAMGAAVISTRTGAAEEMIIDNVSGLLIDRNKDALLHAMNRMKDDLFRAECARNFQREIMTNWTWKVRIDDFRRMFTLFFNLQRVQ